MEKFKQAIVIFFAILGIIGLYGVMMYAEAWFMSWRIEFFGF